MFYVFESAADGDLSFGHICLTYGNTIPSNLDHIVLESVS